MDRISINFYEEVFEKIQKYAEKKKISIAQAVREMVDIGLRVQEQLANKNDQGSEKNAILEKLEEISNFMKKGIVSTYENLYLTRYSVLNIPGKNEEELDRVIEKAKTKSKAYIEGISDKD